MDFNQDWAAQVELDYNANNFLAANYAPVGSIFHPDCPYTMDEIENMFEVAFRQQDHDMLLKLMNSGYLVKIVEEGSFQHFKFCLGLTSNLDQVDDLGYTALMYAAQNNAYVTLDLLIKAGANVSITNPQGMTALACAARNGHVYASCRLLSEMSLQQITAIENNPLFAKMIATFKHKVLKKQELMFTLLSASLPLNSLYPAPCANLDINIKKLILSQVKYPSWYAHRAEYDMELALSKIRLLNHEKNVPMSTSKALIFSTPYQPEEMSAGSPEEKAAPKKKERCILYCN